MAQQEAITGLSALLNTYAAITCRAEPSITVAQAKARARTHLEGLVANWMAFRHQRGIDEHRPDQS